MLRFGFFLALVGLLSCGYRPVAGRLADDVDPGIRYLPFRVRNDTPELFLSHVVADSARAALGRRGLLAPSEDLVGERYYRLSLQLRSISEVPAAFSPTGEVIVYYGELYFDYSVYPSAGTEPVLVASDRVGFRYDYRQNPQDIRLYRRAAIADAVTDWIPELIWRTAAGIRRPATFAAAVTQPSVPDLPPELLGAPIEETEAAQ